MRHLFTILCIAAALVACTSKPKAPGLGITKEAWGQANGKEVTLYTLTNNTGMVVKISTLGGILQSIVVPDKNGNFENVLLGFDSVQGYLGKQPFFGELVGRYANRIAKGKFKLNGTEYQLAVNDGSNHLHGGIKGFGKQVWNAAELMGTDSIGLALTYVSQDMEEGYPGTLTTKVTYVLNNNNELKIFYEAETDKPTVLNLTNHAYFNLSSGKESILNHELTLNADSITPTDSTLIPTGKMVAVAGTGFDFLQPHKIGERIDSIPGGYDINYVLNKKGKELSLAAQVYEPTSGRFMEAYTTEPGIQFYSGNFLDGTLTGSRGIQINKHWGLCLEAQHYPDSPNQPNFPTTVLNPGEKYTQLTVYKFSTK
ncbi:MAG TPA: aldose epimerase family protein [Bacteroidales bacterium]|nr:aldose epimerase family protein [Bacteroidales bacterium]